MIWKDKKIHFVGIKGTGMSGLAELLKEEGAEVSGSDTEEEFPSDILLKKTGIPVRTFQSGNITKEINLVIYSSAYIEENIELKEAHELKITCWSYAEALAKFAERKKTIIITGTHGKTTTTALLGTIFEAAGLDPTVITGDMVKNWENSIRAGKGKYFIAEGDEYQEKFRLFKPVGILIPSLDWDHPDYFKTPEEYLNSFRAWLGENPEAKFISIAEVSKKLGVAAESPEAADEAIFQKSNFVFPGDKYKSNALLAIRLARLFNISESNIITGINNFKGVGRRLDYYANWIVYDYAHHPEEIKATLRALSGKHPDQSIIAVFQPHTYSRTKAFLEEFAKSFSGAKAVFFENIYASAREKAAGVTISDLIKAAKQFHPEVYYFRDFTLEEFLEFCHKKKNPLAVFMGAGDIWQKARQLEKLAGARQKEAD